MNRTNTTQGEPAAILLLLWALLWLVMWSWAILGPLFVVLGALSFVVDLDAYGISIQMMNGQTPQTSGQKLTFMAVGVALGAVGIGFLWLRSRGYLWDWPPKDQRPARLAPDAEQAARARFQPEGPRSDGKGIRPAHAGTRQAGD